MLNEILFQIRWSLPLWFVLTATDWLPANRVTIRLRGALASRFIGRCGRGLQLGPDITLLNSKWLTIGDNVYLAKGTWINALGGVVLEDEVVIAPYVVISSAQHVFKGGSVRFGGSIVAPVSIGAGTWLAAHVSVKCGVRVGKGCLVAANSFVARDIPDGVIVGGVPGSVIGPNVDREPHLFSRHERVRENE